MQLLRQLYRKYVIGPKLLYVFMSLMYYCFYTFRANYCKAYLGMTQKQFGDTMAAMACTSFLSMTFWSSFADYTERHKLILVGISLALGCTFQLLAIPFSNQTVESVFYIFVFILYGFFYGGILPLTDFQALKMISEMPEVGKEMYGRQRMFGSIFFGMTSLIVGILMDWFGPMSINFVQFIFSFIFATFIFFATGSDQNSSFTQQNNKSDSKLLDVKNEEKELGIAQEVEKPKKLDDEVKEDAVKILEHNELAQDPEKPLKKTKRPVIELLTNPNFAFFLFSVFLMGVSRQVMNSFLALFLEEYLKINRTRTGLATLIGMVMSATVFYPGPWLIKTVGVYWMLIVAQALVAMRCWAYTFIPHDAAFNWVVYVIEIMNGLAFGLTQVSGVKIACMTAPKGLEATALGLYASMYTQLSMIVSTFIGGRLYHAKGAIFLFMLTSSLATVTLVMVFVKYLVERNIFVGMRI